MKYIIDIPSKADFVTAYYMEDGLPVMYKSDRIDDLKPYTEPDRKDIEDEVWEFLDFLFTGMSPEERYECFNKVFSPIIVSTMSYQEAKAKYEEWLKQKDEIKVGDEYYDAGEVFVVTNINNSDIVGVIFTDGSVDELSKKELRECSKTGRHFPEVAEFLGKMRGEE